MIKMCMRYYSLPSVLHVLFEYNTRHIITRILKIKTCYEDLTYK